jgi:hypothetical protein
MSTRLTGSCLCGAIRYQVTEAPVWAHQCHCSRCRKSSGSAFAPNLFCPLEAFSFSEGKELLASFKVPGAERFAHVFCRRCGATMPFKNESRGLVGIPMGTLDDDPGFGPRAHIFVDSKAPWFEITDSLPKHSENLESRKRSP